MDVEEMSLEELVAEFRKCEAMISIARDVQRATIRAGRELGIPQQDGFKSPVDWVMSMIDVSRATAIDLVYTPKLPDYQIHGIDQGLIRNVSHPVDTVTP